MPVPRSAARAGRGGFAHIRLTCLRGQSLAS